MSRSARPGRSSGSSSCCCRPTCASTQAWKRVPNRAEADGLRGIGRARSRASPVGSSCSRSTVVADSDGGQGDHDLVGAAGPRLVDQPRRSRRPTAAPGRSRRASAGRRPRRARPPSRPRGLRDQCGRVRRRATSSAPASTGQSIPLLGAVGGLTAPSSGGGASTSGVSLRACHASRRSSCEELRRATRRLLLRTPPVARHDQLAARPGHGDVREPSLLLQLVGPCTRRRSRLRPRAADARGCAAGRQQSPRSGPGSSRPTRASEPGPGRTGNTLVHMPGTKTTSHSRPLARCTVSSLTEFASLGTASARPWPYSSSAAR